jgi:N-acetylneuraminate synthase
MPHTFIIAEAGVNHNGSIDLAKKLIDEAASAGADAVKFQSFKTENNITKSAPKAEYQIQSTGAGESQFDMVKKLELDEQAHHLLADYCKQKNIMFFSTAFDLSSVDLLVSMGVDRMKIPSGEVTNGPLMLKIAQAGLPIILSTGMCTLGDIEQALGVIAFGYLGWKTPSLEKFQEAYFSEEGQKILKEKVTLLHCTTEYPSPLEDVNLKAMLTMQEAFGLRIGYSDHTKGITIPIAAVAMGATIIEKHFTLDRNMEGPDHKASLEPQELLDMVRGIREVEIALGHGRKIVSPSEKKNMVIARRSLIAKKAIKAGEEFTAENLTYMRPGSGIAPVHFWEVVGKSASRDFAAEEIITL